jgi:hypothetical protein
MENGVIVNDKILRSSSSESLRLRCLNTSSVKYNLYGPSRRNLSFVSQDDPVQGPKILNSEENSKNFFIKAKKNIGMANSSKDLSKKTLSNSVNPQKNGEKNDFKTLVEDEIQVLQSKVLKFTLKNIENIKKTYGKTVYHEIIYKNMVACLSRLDPIFHENQLLQFSMSRAREIFQIYMSKPGNVLKAFKSLNKLIETTRIPKKILFDCKKDLNTIPKDKLEGEVLDIYEILVLIISIQNQVFKIPKIPIAKDNSASKTQATLVNEEKTQDISIMDLNTQPFDNENSVSPLGTYESDDNLELLPLQTISLNRDSSSKSKLLEKLYTKMLKPDPTTYETHTPIIPKQKSLSAIKSKTSNQHFSFINKPNYMKSIEKLQKPLKNNENRYDSKSKNRKMEWDELRKVNFI